MTPTLFKAFRHRGRVVERTADELQRMGWTPQYLREASRNKFLACENVNAVTVYRFLREPDWKTPPKPMPARIMPRTEAEYAKAWKDLCRAEGHVARLPYMRNRGGWGSAP